MPNEKSAGDLTAKLLRVGEGDMAALDEVFEDTYEALHRIASRLAGALPPDATSHATSLVHEAYLKYKSGDKSRTWHNSRHFFATAAGTMQALLADHARRRFALKRGGGKVYGDLDESLHEVRAAKDDGDVAIGIESLRTHAPDSADIFMLRHYCGLSRQQTADVQRCTLSQVDDHTEYAKSYLSVELNKPYTDSD